MEKELVSVDVVLLADLLIRGIVDRGLHVFAFVPAADPDPELLHTRRHAEIDVAGRSQQMKRCSFGVQADGQIAGDDVYCAVSRLADEAVRPGLLTWNVYDFSPRRPSAADCLARPRCDNGDRHFRRTALADAFEPQ
jgi:hypothetical protein